MSREAAARVDAMWAQLGLGELVPSPSVEGHLVSKML